MISRFRDVIDEYVRTYVEPEDVTFRDDGALDFTDKGLAALLASPLGEVGEFRRWLAAGLPEDRRREVERLAGVPVFRRPVEEFVSEHNRDVRIVDGEPQEVVNVAGLAELVQHSPLGIDEALRRLRAAGCSADTLEQVREVLTEAVGK